MPLGVGSTFADYTIERRLGAGGMGEVYLARHPRLPRSDALKLLGANVSSEPTFRERFLREADLASTLWHPHIVGVHDRGEYDGQLWISMDFVDGQDASGLIADRYRDGMPPDLVVAIVTAVASALDYAHEQGLLHRDVKPANVLLARVDDPGARRILLTDFGIARTADDNAGLTATNTTVGTVDYMSPEQLMGEALDGRTDQYSLAATAYHLLAGVPPFSHSNAAVVISRHLSTPAPALSEARPDLAALGGPLARALSKDRQLRFASCSEFARALADAVQAGGAPDAMPTSVLDTPTSRVPVPPPVPPTVAALVPPVLGQTPPPRPTVPPPPAFRPEWSPAPNVGPAYAGPQQSGPQYAGPQHVDPPAPGGLPKPLLWVLGGAVVLLLVGALVLLLGRGGSESSVATDAGPTSTRSVPEPTFTTERVEPVPTTTPPAPPPPPQTSWSAVVVGSCDEGGSCGVRQRNAPFNNAPSLYSNVVRDGQTLTLVCQTTGDTKSSSGYGSSSVWYRLDNGAYINAVYLTVNGTGIPQC